MKFLSEEDALKAKQKLGNELSLDPLTEDYEKDIELKQGEMNWMDLPWEQCRSKAIDFIEESAEEYSQENPNHLVNYVNPLFIANDRDEIIGKPQLIHSTIQKINLFRKYRKVNKNKEGDFTSQKYIYKFINDAIDKRSVGNVMFDFSLDFWAYRIIHNHKEYYVLSREELPLRECSLRGMILEISDTSEFSKSMKLGSITRLFFLKDYVSAVKMLDEDKLRELTINITEQQWFDYLNYHPLGTVNNFPYQVNLLRSTQLLSGKVDGWPLHLAVIGPAGTRKSMGYVETIAYKFNEESEIVEGGNSRIKALSPSFKEKPANIGYLARCERMGWIDELGKMVEFETLKHQVVIGNVLGELNFLLENKKRTVGSGNDNECVVQANAKFLFVTNPLNKKSKIYNHVGIIDQTTMSRILWWVQNEEEQSFVLGSEGITRFPPTPRSIYVSNNGDNNNNNNAMSNVSVGVGGISDLLVRDDFLSIFDTLNSFLIEIDDIRVNKISQTITNMSKEPMRSVWRARAEHHTKLVIDGICKHRCLFIDKDYKFNLEEEDYIKAQELLKRMCLNWDTDLAVNKFVEHNSGELQ